LDRFIKHEIKPQAYLRYGDDFFIISDKFSKLQNFRKKTIKFLKVKLKLTINPKNDIMVKVKRGLKFLGVEIFSKGRRLNKRNWIRARNRSNLKNISSYDGLIRSHSKIKRVREFNWIILEKIN